MFVDIRWHLGKTMGQLQMEVVKAAFSLNLNNVEKTAKSLGISVEEVKETLTQIQDDLKVQEQAIELNKQRDSAMRARLTAKIPSHQGIQWDKSPDQTKVIPSLQAVGNTIGSDQKPSTKKPVQAKQVTKAVVQPAAASDK